MIVVENLSKSYKVAVKDTGLQSSWQHFFQRQYQNIQAVRSISFQIEPGEVVGFLGANGAGKTTTLKMLTGLVHPTSGYVQVAGAVPFQRRNSFLQKITLVMGQKQQLIWDLPAIDSLRVNGAVYGLSDRQFQQRLGELTEMLGLTNQLTQPVRKLSLGERMKTELMAALLHQPQILFLDEPTLGLDVNAQVAVRQFLQEYNQRYQATILLTSHYMADITALCQRVLLIHQGLLIYDGNLDDLIQRFSPFREVKIELAQDITPEQLANLTYGEIEAVNGREIRFLVKREQLTGMVSKLLADLEVADLTVTDPPVEEIIGRVFRQGVAGS
jgi:ABC-2 type transport system ATP-binding protein